MRDFARRKNVIVKKGKRYVAKPAGSGANRSAISDPSDRVPRLMRLRLATPLALLALAVPVAACGEDEKDQYIDDFKPLNDKLLDVGRDLGVAVQGADDQSDAALAKQFSGLATRLEGVKKEIAALDTPADLKDEAAALDKNLDATVGDLENISEAAGKNNAQGAAAATVQLATDAQRVNTAQNKLAKATGADVGAN